MSSDETPSWVHLRPPKLTISKLRHVDLSLTDVAYPPLDWVPQTNSRLLCKKYLNDTIPVAKFKL